MFPHHIGDRAEGEPQENLDEPEVTSQDLGETRIPQEEYQEHQEILRKADDLEARLREEYKEQTGAEAPKEKNLSLWMVEQFRRLAKEAQDLRKAVRYVKNPAERTQAMLAFTEKKKELDEYLSYGPSFEKAYREYLRAQNQYVKFSSGMAEGTKLHSLLHEPTFGDSELDEKLSRKELARLEGVMGKSKVEEPDIEESLKALETVFDKDSKEYEEAKQELLARVGTEKPKTKGEIKERVKELQEQSKELWENPMVRYFWQKKEIDKMLEDFSEGKDVVETQSVIKSLNKLNEWEGEHQRTTIGGVLVGPPGVGKTTLVRHYLQEKERDYVYLDLSEEVTRYMLYGSKAIEFRSPTEYYHQLAADLEGLDEAGLKDFVAEHQEVVKNTFKVTEGQSAVVLVGQIVEELEKGEKAVKDDPALSKKLTQLKGKMNELTQTAFRRELAGQFGHLASRNGWRDGVIISALRRGDNIIFDEFNKNKNWSLIYGLMTAKPGENWYFADNDEEIKVPEDWRMYFTANIGAKHGVYPVPEAFASRATGKTLEVGYPPRSEEMKVALCSMSNPEGDILRSKDDLAKLYILVNEVFPKVRKFIEERNQIIPISYRLLRDLGEKLVSYSDPKTKKPVYQPTGKSFDEVLYEVMIGSYSVYEDKTVSTEIANICTSVGLMLDDSIKDKMESWVGKEELESRKKTFEEHKEDFKEIVKKIQGISRDVSELPLPDQKQI
ncbi:MAG: hypothetical protein UR22_C0001G0010 [Parcubacteria group bacterium GW2011_GWC2_32_10]|nr:MAG: hypothetical protein UR22_C0001G0010 [Parcubacteria group bacterium GW2011_GWC2_32_10]